jgi:phytoene synthase
VDEGADKARAVLGLRDRLDLVYLGRPRDAAPDRAFAAVVDQFQMPRALPEALLEGLAWDAIGRRYASVSDLRAYCARVASAVGAMMTVLMGVRSADALARACDLGLGMQLTNIARDVGEDARAGRLYLPLDWLMAEGIDPDRWLARPQPLPAILRLTERLLAEADRHYLRSEAGVPALPLACRPGIYAARHIYAGIGTRIRAAGGDSVTRRATTGKARKLGWLALAVARTAVSAALPQSAVLHAGPAPETAWLVHAAAQTQPVHRRSDALVGIMSQLEARDRGMA